MQQIKKDEHELIDEVESEAQFSPTNEVYQKDSSEKSVAKIPITVETLFLKSCINLTCLISNLQNFRFSNSSISTSLSLMY